MTFSCLHAKETSLIKSDFQKFANKKNTFQIFFDKSNNDMAIFSIF